MLCRHRDPSHMAMRLSAWCRACPHTVRLDLRALVAGGHGDVPLIHLPMRCRCGSDQFGIIVGEVSAGKSGSLPRCCPACVRHDGCGGRPGELLTGIEGASNRPVRRIVLLAG